MAVRIEKSGNVWTVIHSRPEACNAMDPDSATALYEAFPAFNADDSAWIEVKRGDISGAGRFGDGKGRHGDFSKT